MTDRATLKAALGRSWSPASSTRWREDNPALGQCGVTALVVNDRLGGDILKTRVGDDWHFYNRLGEERVDFTAEQFGVALAYDDIVSSREEAASDTNDEQYRALSGRLAAALAEG